MAAPTYAEHPELWQEAQRAAHGPTDPAHVRRLEEITHGRGADWCTAVLGRPFAGLRYLSVAEAELLRLAHERDLNPPMPGEIVAARQAAADHRAILALQRQQQAAHDQREWTTALDQAGVPAETLQVRANVRGGGRSAHRGGGPLHHVVPVVDLLSGPERRPRRHPAGRALCETEHRPTPLRLGEPSDELPTCVRCLAWTTRVRPAPEVGTVPPGAVADPGQRAQPGRGAVAAGLQESPAVDPDAVVAAARVVTARNYGSPVLGHHVLNSAVWVDLGSWPRAWEVATYLAELGYQVSGPSPAPDSHGWSVVVSGWSAHGLSERVIELERAVRDIELHHGDVASEAVGRYRDYLRQGLSDDAARRQAVADIPLTPQPPTRLGPAVPERDLTLGPPEHRGALVRVAAAQQAWRMLSTTDAAGAAVDMYVECRQVNGYPVDRAQAAAVAEVSERAKAKYQKALAAARKLEAAGHGTAAGGQHRPVPAFPDTRLVRHTLGTPPPGSGTASPRAQSPPPRTAGRPHHRGR